MCRLLAIIKCQWIKEETCSSSSFWVDQIFQNFSLDHELDERKKWKYNFHVSTKSQVVVSDM